MNPTRSIEGRVLRMRCHSCDCVSVDFQFSGENDLVTMDLSAFSSRDGTELVIAEFNNDEIKAGQKTQRELALQRISQQLGRSDLKFPKLVGHISTKIRRNRFKDFLATYKPPIPCYQCPDCGIEGMTLSYHTSEEFRNMGDKITLLGNMALSN